MNADDITRALIRKMNVRTALIVPNVSWGLVGWGECDLLSMSGSGFLTEFEIKISAADIKREWKKRRWTHRMLRGEFNNLIKYYYMAVPEKLFDVAKEAMPEDIGGGIVIADKQPEPKPKWMLDEHYNPNTFASWEIQAKANNRARKLTEKEKFQLARLGTLRHWSRFMKEPAPTIKQD